MNRMNFVSVLAVALLASQVFGAVPNLINYQGVLTNDEGVVVADGTYKLTVRLYDVATGGSALFTESHDAVAVVDGVFSLSLGSVNTALGTLAFNDPYYLSLEVNDSGVELAPRVAIQAVPYALNTSSIAGTGVSGAAPNMDEVLQFNGTQWVPAVVSGVGGDITSVVAGEGLTGGATTGDATLDVATGVGLQVSGDQVRLTDTYANGDAYDTRFVNEGQSESVTAGMIAPGAITDADISASAAITASKIADGPGSGLNADLLDGQQAVDFLATGSNLADLGDVSSTAPAQYEVLQFNGSEWAPATVSTGGDNDWVEAGADIYRPTGNVGIGITTPGERLDVVGNVHATGNLVANGDVQGDQLVLTQPSGSPPMTISSTNLVSNLNADLLDGQQAADFLAAGSNLADLGDVSGTAPSTDDVLQYNGSQWAPATIATGGGDITSVVAGAGLTGGATSGDANLDVATGTGLQVSGDQVQLTAPYASGSAHDGRFVNQTGDTMTGNLIVNARVGVGMPSPGEELEVLGEQRLYDLEGFRTVYLGIDGSFGGGGFFQVTRDSLNHVGFEVNGNWADSRDTRVAVTGQARSVVLDMSLDGDGSVQLPGGSINADETAEEPGVAHEGNGSTITLSGTTMVDVETITIEVPGPGYVMLEGRTNARFLNTTAQNQLYIQVDDDLGGAIEGFYWAKVGLTEYAGIGLAYFPVYCARTFQVAAAGSYTFRLEAAEVPGNGAGATCSMYQTQLSAVYYPSAYGAVSAAVSDASEFREVELVRPDLDPTDEALVGGYARVDLRELERRAREARQRALEAELELQRAREAMSGNQ